MAVPVTPTADPVAAVIPRGTPAWLIKLVALAVAASGPALIWIDPTGKITTAGAQAVVVLGFLVVAATIFTVHVAYGAIHEYGWSKAALDQGVTAEIGELTAMWPEIKTTFDAARPALDAIPGVPAALAATQTELVKVRAELAAVPAGQRQAALDALTGLLGQKPAAVAPITASLAALVDPPG